MSIHFESSDFIRIEGKTMGPTVLVVCGTHGNETIGMDVRKWLMEHIAPADIMTGSLEILIGNPAAVAAGKRFIDTDLNRLMSEPELDRIALTPPRERKTEEKRALEIAPLLQGKSVVLDVHATNRDSAEAFLFTKHTPMHHTVARRFPFSYIVSPAEEGATAASCIDNYADAYGGFGITIEAGSIADPQKFFPETICGILNCMMAYGVINTGTWGRKMLELGKPISSTEPGILLAYQEVRPDSSDVRIAHPQRWYNGCPYKAGEILLWDDGQPVYVKQPSYLIFPKDPAALKRGEPAVTLAHKPEAAPSPNPVRKRVNLPLGHPGFRTPARGG